MARYNRYDDAKKIAVPRRIKKTTEKGNVDFVMFFVILGLVLFGLVMVFSSSYYYAMTDPAFNDKYHFLKRQLVWACAGLFCMTITMNLNYKIYKKLSFLAYVVSNFLLVLVLIVGTKINGQRRWLGFGNFGFQPSEIAKVAVILYLSYYIVSHKGILNDIKGFFKCLCILGVPVVLIAVSNLSTAIVVAGIGMVIIFVASPKVWYFIVAIVPIGAAGVIAVSLPQFAYRFSRIKVWRDPFSDPLGKGFQTIQSLFAVASGGMFGLGLGQSRQKTFIPEAYNDIIFAIICEELGFVGAAFVIFLFVILIWRGLRAAMNAVDSYATLVAVGIAAMIAIQAIINISVVTNTIPNTGMPLPFISYGGSSLLIMMATVGILLNITKYQKTLD